MAKTRRLTDLYVRGKEVTIDDGQGGDGVTVWIQKLNPVDQASVLRKASARRATQLAFRNDPDSLEYKAAYGEAVEFATRETLVDLAVRERLTSYRLKVEAEIENEEEWKKDDYLQGLYDSWNDGLKEEYARDKNDPEAKRVFDELKRFNEQVDKAVDGERRRLIAEAEGQSDDTLAKTVIDLLLRQAAGMVFMEEYELQEIYYATRSPEKHSKRYFESVDEVRSLEQEAKDRLLAEYRELTVEPMEGKGSAGTPPSSPSSEQPVQGGMVKSSGLMVVSQ